MCICFILTITVLMMKIDVYMYICMFIYNNCCAACSCVHDCSRNAVVGRRADMFLFFFQYFVFLLFTFWDVKVKGLPLS